MPRPADPRARAALLEAGERLIHERGYNGAAVKEIVDAAGVPKGSFYGRRAVVSTPLNAATNSPRDAASACSRSQA